MTSLTPRFPGQKPRVKGKPRDSREPDRLQSRCLQVSKVAHLAIVTISQYVSIITYLMVANCQSQRGDAGRECTFAVSKTVSSRAIPSSLARVSAATDMRYKMFHIAMLVQIFL